MLTFLLGNKYARAFIVCLAAFLMGAGIATWKVSSHYIHKINLQEASYEAAVLAAGETAKAIDVVVVEKYKTKIVKIEEKKKAIDERIENELKEDDQRCSLGPAFVRLHNDAARPVPDAVGRPDGPTTKRAARPSP